jgi:hypothetical protein
MRLSLLGHELLAIVLTGVVELQWRKRDPLVLYMQVRRILLRRRVLVYITSRRLVCSLSGHSIPWRREELDGWELEGVFWDDDVWFC